jgi:hypothetical protein
MRVSASPFRNLAFSAKSSGVERDPGADGFKEDLATAIQLASVPSRVHPVASMLLTVIDVVPMLIAHDFLPLGNLSSGSVCCHQDTSKRMSLVFRLLSTPQGPVSIL